MRKILIYVLSSIFVLGMCVLPVQAAGISFSPTSIPSTIPVSGNFTFKFTLKNISTTNVRFAGCNIYTTKTPSNVPTSPEGGLSLSYIDGVTGTFTGNNGQTQSVKWQSEGAGNDGIQFGLNFNDSTVMNVNTVHSLNLTFKYRDANDTVLKKYNEKISEGNQIKFNFSCYTTDLSCTGSTENPTPDSCDNMDSFKNIEYSKTVTVGTTATSKHSTTNTITPAPTVVSTTAVALPAVFTAEGNTSTDISKITDKTKISSMTLDVVGFNTVKYTHDIDLSNVDLINNLDKIVVLDQKAKVSVDSTAYPNLNKPASITMRGLTFTKNPIILRDGKSSDGYVSNMKYDASSGVLTFDVIGFSTYEAVEDIAVESTGVKSIEVKKNNNIVPLVLVLTVIVTIVGGTAYYFITRKKGLK